MKKILFIILLIFQAVAINAQQTIRIGGSGADGKTVLNGTTNPTNGIGADGDFYINTTTYEIFGPKASGTWGSGTSLIGSSSSSFSALTGNARDNTDLDSELDLKADESEVFKKDGSETATGTFQMGGFGILGLGPINMTGGLTINGSNVITTPSLDDLKRVSYYNSDVSFRIEVRDRPDTGSSFTLRSTLQYNYATQKWEIDGNEITTNESVVAIHPDTGESSVRIGIGTEAEKAAATLLSGDLWISTNQATAKIVTAGSSTIDFNATGKLAYLNNADHDVTSFTISNSQEGDVFVIYLNQATKPTFTGVTTNPEPDTLDWDDDSLANINLKLTGIVEYDGTITLTYTKRP